MMKKNITVKFILLFILLVFSPKIYANQNEFCAGFTEGYKAVKGDMVIVPICPIAPITPIGSTAYREGLKRGMARAAR